MQKILFILSELNDADVEWMIAAGRRERRAAGSVLIEEGRTTDALSIVLDGELVASVHAAQAEREIERLGVGAIVGEVSFVDARPPSATVRAATDSLLLSVPRTRLSAKLGEDIGFAARFYRAVALSLAYHLRDKVAQLAERDQGAPAREEDRREDELDANVLDKVYLAGQRFDRILKRLAGEYAG